ncbi:MAG: AAA family ATPase [Dehalococcoidia bacterium]|nr:AAA family ATPase [Dehalococcoidia bacterium]
MVTVFVTSLSSGAGKTALCAGIGKYLAGGGKKVGYIRPLIAAPPAGADALFIKEVLSLQEPLDALCPSFTNENQFNASFRKAFDAVAGGKDVVIIEGANNPNIARASDAKVVVIATYGEIAEGKVTVAYKLYGPQAIGLVVNKVPVSQLSRVKSEVTAACTKANIPILGILPESRALLTFSIAELAKLIDGQVLNNAEKTGELAGSFMLGAMTVDSGLTYFNLMADKVAVIRSERADMQIAALQTSTRAVVVSGSTPMIPQVQVAAEDKSIPLITTPLDVVTVASRVEEAVVKTRFHQKSKLAPLMALLEKEFNFQSFSKAAGL